MLWFSQQWIFDRIPHWPWSWPLCFLWASRTPTASATPQWTCCKPHAPPEDHTRTQTHTKVTSVSVTHKVPAAELLLSWRLKDRSETTTHNVETHDVRRTAQKALRTTCTVAEWWDLVGPEVETEQSRKLWNWRESEEGLLVKGRRRQMFLDGWSNKPARKRLDFFFFCCFWPTGILNSVGCSINIVC